MCVCLKFCSWLFACAKIQQIAPVDEHTVTAPQHSHSHGSTAGQHGSSSAKNPSNSSVGCVAMDTSTEGEVLQQKIPFTSFHPQFDVKVRMYTCMHKSFHCSVHQSYF